MKKVLIISIIVIGMFFLGVYSYNVRTDYNTDKLEKQAEIYNYKVDALSYALKLVPDDIKNEVFVKAVLSEYEEIEKVEEIMKILKPDYKPQEDVKGQIAEEKKKEVTASNVMNAIMDS